MQSAPHLRLVYSSGRHVDKKRRVSLRERVQTGIDRTPLTYAAISTCAILALGSAERLWGKMPPNADTAWSGLADKAVLAVMPVTLPLCVLTDAVGVATYPWRLWTATRPEDESKG
jgi:hypothetical protein